MTPTPWIILVDYNGLDDTHQCLQSLQHLTQPASIVVVDNASQCEVRTALQSLFPHVHFVRAQENGGWAGGNNLGLAYALERGAEFVILLNNDTVVCPDLVDLLAAAFQHHPEYGILGPVIRFMEPPHDVQTEGVLFNRPGQVGFFQRKTVALTQNDPPHVTEVDIVNGCCLAVRRAVVERIGCIDEKFFLVHEESDFCLRAQRAGFRCGVIDHACVYHKGSTSFKRAGMRMQRYYDARNLYLLLKKHRRHRHIGRRWGETLFHYWNYVYYRYAIELEAGCGDAGRAVLEGISDTLTANYGRHRQRDRYVQHYLQWLFTLRHSLTKRFLRPHPERGKHAPLVR
jgi:GT2 family glycosyltransferase